MKVLIMGGTEFVSSSLAKYLIAKGYVVDIFTRGVKLIEYDGIRTHLKGDRKSINDLKMNVSNESYEYVFDISAYTKDDVEILTKVLNKENLKRYIFCSSGAVYIPSKEVITEEFARGENTNWGKYGLDKKEAEDYLLSLYEKEGFPITIFRPTYIYGDGNNLFRESYFFERIAKGLDIPIPNGNETTQFIYIGDLLKVFENAMHIDKAIGQAYNLTHSQIVTWRQLIETTMKIVNKKVNIKEVDNERLNLAVREYFPFRNVTYLLNTKKSQSDGLYLPQIDLFNGLKMAYTWYCKANPKLIDAKMDKIDLALNS